MVNASKAITYMVLGVLVLGIGSVVLTGDTVVDFYDNLEQLDNGHNGTNNVSDLYILGLSFLPWAIIFSIFAVLIGGALKELGKI